MTWIFLSWIETLDFPYYTIFRWVSIDFSEFSIDFLKLFDRGNFRFLPEPQGHKSAFN